MPPQAWNKLRLESRGLRVLVYAKVLFIFLSFGRRAQRRPFRTYCQYSYVLHLLLYYFFFLLSFFLFTYTMNTHNHWYSFIPMDIPILLYFKSPFLNLKGTVQFQKRLFDTVQVFPLQFLKTFLPNQFFGQLWG